MRAAEIFAAAALLWQSALLVNIGTPADPEHLRYAREVVLPAGTTGLVCAVLDPAVLAHTASSAHSDLRLYRRYEGSNAEAEVPYLLTESGPEPVSDSEVHAEHVAQNGAALQFELRMPPRVYSEVNLHLDLQNFVGTAHVFAESAHGQGARDVGTFPVFDLRARRLGRWTLLPMAETDAPVLQVRLSLRTPEGRPLTGVSPAVVGGAAVPPSRERETLFSPVTSTTRVERRTTASLAEMRVAAHVPVERVRVEVAPGFEVNYYREVTVSARPDRQDLTETEIMDAGAIQHVRMPSGDPGLAPIDVRQDVVDATLGATLASSATVRVFVQNGEMPPLPIRRVTLEMRERRLCFLAAAEAAYRLRYGDPALSPPVYDTSGLLPTSGTPAVVSLGPEVRNRGWQPRSDTRPYLDRHPELFWVIVLVCGGMMGASALHYVQQRGGDARH